MKPSKTFKLSKTFKRMMCSITDPVMRNDFKRMMIQAQIARDTTVKRDRNDRKENFAAPVAAE